MNVWRFAAVLILSMVAPPVALIFTGAPWGQVALVAAANLGMDVLWVLSPPRSVTMLAVRLAFMVGVMGTALALALRAGMRTGNAPRPWFRRWYALPAWLAAAIAITPHYWLGYGFRTYVMPITAMEPTLLAGDRVVAPLIDRRAVATIHRGEVVAFSGRTADGSAAIRRVIGLPGDRIRIERSIVILNGTPLRREGLGPFVRRFDGMTVTAERYREEVPTGGDPAVVAYEILLRPASPQAEDVEEMTVPPEHLFVLADNRDNAMDSRWTQDVGFIPFARVVARPAFIYWSEDLSRIGARVD